MFAVIGLTVLIIASLLIVSGLDTFLSGDRARVVPSEVSTPSERGTPLEPDQGEQKQRYLAEQQELLSSYGWVDRQLGIARIPIEDAMQLYVIREEAAE